jgi:predicted nucleotidyltransferase
MRIDPEETVACQPALMVRRALRKLRMATTWSAAELEAAAGLPAGRGRDFARRLQRDGLVESCGPGVWSVSQAGCALAAATAAKRLTRASAERALAEFMERVALVNERPYFLGKVVRVVLFGSMLDPGTDRPSDVDLAIEIDPKETDYGRLQEQNYERAEMLAATGHRFRNAIEIADWWRQEVFRFLKAGSRAISLADYRVEKALILTVPHHMLIGDDEPPPAPELTPGPEPKPPKRRRRRPNDCPF